jgi:predicted nuclease of predicted toxin-antitoxin system
MKFKIDENLPVEIADLFRAAGFDAITVLEQTLGGEADQICDRLRASKFLRLYRSRADLRYG